MSEFKNRFSEFTLIPGSGGCFEFKVGDELIFSKLKEGRFPEHEEVLEPLREKIPA